MVELKGSLGGIGLPALVQLIGELHHSGTLELGGEEPHGLLAFEEGHLVAAEFGEEHGLPALASCARALKDAEFTFIEGAPTPEQTLDFGPPELKSLLQRVMNGDFAAAERASNHVDQVEVEHACPLLGFADDRSRHYGRATALHRCYASGTPSLITSVEQRDLCLSGRFAACPRYRNWESPRPNNAAIEPVTLAPTVAAYPSEATQLPAAPTSTQPEPERDAPIRVTASVSPAPAEAPTRRSLLTPDLGGMEFLAIGLVLGVVLVFVLFAVVLPALTGGSAQKPSTAAPPAPAQQPAPTVIQPPAPAAKPTALPTVVPTVAPSPTAPPRPPTPTTVTQPAVAGVTAAHALVDVRFAQGPAKGWADNPPFAMWSDGAYRFQATQAEKFVAFGVPTDVPLTDVLVTATLRKTGGPPGGGYGVIVRDQGPEPRDGENQEGNYYVMETGDLGDYGIWRRDGDHWIDLVPWTPSPSVRQGGSPNDLAVRAVGDQLTFVVNGAQLASITDGTLLAGGVGLYVGGDYNQVALDRFSVALPD